MMNTKPETKTNTLKKRNKMKADTKGKIKLLIFDFIFLLLWVAADQYTKYLAVIKLKNQPAYSVIDGILEFNYLENVGAAFGMLPNQKFFFVFIALIFIGVIIFVLTKTPYKKKFTPLHILLTLIAAGAIGNMIDRLRLNYVVDFIYVVFVRIFGQPFPIFNVADMCVTISTVVLVFFIFFVYKDADFEFLSFKQKKFRELK
jgi:signal peptidase II